TKAERVVSTKRTATRRYACACSRERERTRRARGTTTPHDRTLSILHAAALTPTCVRDGTLGRCAHRPRFGECVRTNTARAPRARPIGALRAPFPRPRARWYFALRVGRGPAAPHRPRCAGHAWHAMHGRFAAGASLAL